MWYFENAELLPPKNKFIESGFQRRNVTIKHVSKANEGFYYINIYFSIFLYKTLFTINQKHGLRGGGVERRRRVYEGN